MAETHVTKKHRARTIVVCVVIIFIVANVLDLLFIGNVAYLMKWQQCGEKPYIATQPVHIGFGAEPIQTVVRKDPSILDDKHPLVLDINHASMLCDLNEVKDRYGTNFQLVE